MAPILELTSLPPGYSYVSQDGSLPGYETLTTILPTRKLGVFTAFTGDGGARAYAAKILVNVFTIDLLLHGQPWVDQSSVCTVMDKMVDATMATEPRPTYLGRASEPVGFFARCRSCFTLGWSSIGGTERRWISQKLRTPQLEI